MFQELSFKRDLRSTRLPILPKPGALHDRDPGDPGHAMGSRLPLLPGGTQHLLHAQRGRIQESIL